MLNRTLASALLSFAALIGITGSSAQAQMLIDPTGGTVLSTPGNDDAVYGGRTLGFTGTFYGAPHTTVDVSVNGFLSFSGVGSGFNQPLPVGVALIGAMWDDLFVYSGQSITEKKAAGAYYSVTWRIGTYAYGHVSQQFQIVWFGAAQTIRGFNFLPNDIVFCYETVGAPPWSATIGLDAGDGVHFSPLPGTTDGFITDATSSLLPRYPSSHAVFLFRPVGNSYISMQILTNSPCPADFNNDGARNSQDFFDFITAFFAGC